MSENKTGRYFKYAIGEIILVVFGILIALQINTWNENRKDINLKSTYVNRLINDLQKDSLILKNITERVTKRQLIIKNFMNSFDLENQDSSRINILEKYFTLGWGSASFSSQKNTYLDLSQTGNMSLFKDTNIREKILNYYSLVSDYMENRIINENWVLPIDVTITQQTPALKFSQKTKALYKNEDIDDSVEEIIKNKDILKANAATHYWVNETFLMTFNTMNEELQELLNLLKKE